MYNSVKERIAKYLKDNKIPQATFCERIGLSRGYLGAMRKSFQPDTINKIAIEFPDLNIEWLLTGLGHMLKTEVQLLNPQACLVDEKNRTPLYDFNAFMEIMTGAKPAPFDYISVPNVSACDGATIVRGNSMAPRLQAGDIVLFKIVKNKTRIYWGELYLVLFTQDGSDYVLLQYLRKSESDGFVKLSGYDSTATPHEIPLESIKALAIVKAGIAYLSML